jgi:hypothetical protein
MQHCVSWTPGTVPVPDRSPSADKLAIRNLEGENPARRCRCVAAREGTKTQNPPTPCTGSSSGGWKVGIPNGGLVDWTCWTRKQIWPCATLSDAHT